MAALVTDESVEYVVVLQWSVGGVLISLSQVTKPVGEYTTESVMHGQCDVRPTVTFQVTQHQRHLAGGALWLGR